MSRDVEDIIECMKKVMEHGYSSERDLFIATATLDMLARTSDFSLSLRIRKAFPDVKSPLLNFIDMLYDIIKIKDFGLLKEMINKYGNHLKRDPALMT